MKILNYNTVIALNVFKNKESILKELKKQRILWGGIFSLIEENTLDNVVFLNFSLL